MGRCRLACSVHPSVAPRTGSLGLRDIERKTVTQARQGGVPGVEPPSFSAVPSSNPDATSCMCHIISYALHGTATESEVDAMSNECYITIPGTRMYCIFFSETTATRSLQRRA